MKHAICGFLVVGAALLPLMGQDSRGRVQGIVTDATQALVVGAKVTLANDDTGVSTTTESNTNGNYIFDFVNPGKYTVTAEQAGFSRFVQQNVAVQVRSDITVNIALQVGGLAESVTVTEAPPAVQFNTTTMDQVVDQKTLNAMPVLARSPFSLALLNPAVTTSYAPNLLLPFNKWQNAGFKIGGGAGGGQNDMLLDGAPTQIGTGAGYVPPMDAVQEFTVQQNSVDAEFGHTAGGIMSLSMKSGTNEFHGTAYYFGRNPKLNARTNSVTNTQNLVRNHIGGGTIGAPIIKNKLFTFFSYEQWKMTEANSALFTLPTELERAGDFSMSRNAEGGLREIFDPFSTQLNPATGAVTRNPFPQNMIPTSRIDPTAQKMLADIWLPNNAGINVAGTNNFRIGYPRYFRFWNLSDRTDWNISDRLKVFGRFSRGTHNRDPVNYANSPAAPINGYDTQTRDYAGDVVYTLSPSTVLNVRASYSMLIDDLRAGTTEIGLGGMEKLWPNKWYEPYLKETPIVFYPNLQFVGSSGTTSIGRSSSWREHANTYSYHARLSSQKGIHYLKGGIETRRGTTETFYPISAQLLFNADFTADTFNAPRINLRGDPYATFLLGAVRDNSRAYYVPLPEVNINYYAGYFQDDIKLTRRLTLNLGLRYEYTGGMTERENRISRNLDLTSPIPEMQATPPQFPADVTKYNQPFVPNGAWIYTDENNRAGYDTPNNVFLPRAGIAFRVNDKTALRVGYARYALPIEVFTSFLGSQLLYGFDATTTVAPSLEGRPGGVLADPFPASNPLILPVGKAYGRYTNLGSSEARWYDQSLQQGMNDRINVSFQRQLPGRFALDATYFLNLGHNYPYQQKMNLADPNLTYTHKTALQQSVTNPFYQYLTPDKFPGQLRNQPRVTISSLLKPYPQYGTLLQEATAGPSQRYQAMQLRVQRQFGSGLGLLATYVYNREKQEQFFNDIAEYAGDFTYINNQQPRHRAVIAGTYDFPFGKGRPYLSGTHPVLNGILGGWTLSGISIINSGQFLRFNNQVLENKAPTVYRQRDQWFDKSAWSLAPAFTPRTNPYQYEGVTGPRNWNVDAALSKFFNLTERWSLEFRMDAYNLTNTFVGAQPDLSPTSATYGRITNQFNQGREMQYTVRLHF